jgi:hypothetical protein
MIRASAVVRSEVSVGAHVIDIPNQMDIVRKSGDLPNLG